MIKTMATKTMAIGINTRPRQLRGTQDHKDQEGKNLRVAGVTTKVF